MSGQYKTEWHRCEVAGLKLPANKPKTRCPGLRSCNPCLEVDCGDGVCERVGTNSTKCRCKDGKLQTTACSKLELKWGLVQGICPRCDPRDYAQRRSSSLQVDATWMCYANGVKTDKASCAASGLRIPRRISRSSTTSCPGIPPCEPCKGYDCGDGYCTASLSNTTQCTCKDGSQKTDYCPFDPCANVTCRNGKCMLGSCICDDAHVGPACLIPARFACFFALGWAILGTCSTLYFQYFHGLFSQRPDEATAHASAPTSSKTGQKLAEDHEDKACVICLDQPRMVACVPCGHLAFCVKCAASAKRGEKTCPVCRRSNVKLCRIFF